MVAEWVAPVATLSGYQDDAAARGPKFSATPSGITLHFSPKGAK
jgi:hypothetical protein